MMKQNNTGTLKNIDYEKEKNSLNKMFKNQEKGRFKVYFSKPYAQVMHIQNKPIFQTFNIYQLTEHIMSHIDNQYGKIDGTSLYKCPRLQINGENLRGADKFREVFAKQDYFHLIDNIDYTENYNSSLSEQQVQDLRFKDDQYIKDFWVQNKFGKIEFIDQIDYKDVQDLNDVVKIEQDHIELYPKGQIPGLNKGLNAKCYFYYYNFGQNQSFQVNTLKQWCEKNNFTFISYIDNTLKVQVDGYTDNQIEEN